MTSQLLNNFLREKETEKAFASFNELYSATITKVTVIALKYCKEQYLAEDACNATYTKVWLEWEKVYQGKRSYDQLPINWLFTIARNEAIDISKKYKARLLEKPQDNDSTIREQLRAEERRNAGKVIEELEIIAGELEPDSGRILNAILTCDSNTQAAEVLGMPESTLRTKLPALASKLRDILISRGFSLGLVFAILAIPKTSSASSEFTVSSPEPHELSSAVKTGISFFAVLAIVAGLTFFIMSAFRQDDPGVIEPPPSTNPVRLVNASFINYSQSSLGALAYASTEGYFNDEIMLASNAIDGDSNTSWEGSECPGTLNIELQHQYMISRIEVETGKYTQMLTVSVSPDGTAWDIVQKDFRTRDNAYQGLEASEIVSVSFIERPIKFIRIEISESDAIPGSQTCTSIAEVRAFVLPNLVHEPGVVAKASSEVVNNEYSGTAANAIDGNNDTCWSAASLPSEIDISLPEARLVSRIEVDTRHQAYTTIMLQGSRDGIEWKTFMQSHGPRRVGISYEHLEHITASIPSQLLRFIKVTVLTTSAEEHEEIKASISEIRLYNVPNLALAANGAEVSASSIAAYLNKTCYAECAIDGDSRSHWSAESTPAWIQVELPKVEILSRIDIDFDFVTHFYDLEVSINGEDWEVLAENRMTRDEIADPKVSEGIQPEVISFAPRKVKFIRVNINQTNAADSDLFRALIREIRAYGGYTDDLNKTNLSIP